MRRSATIPGRRPRQARPHTQSASQQNENAAQTAAPRPTVTPGYFLLERRRSRRRVFRPAPVVTRQSPPALRAASGHRPPDARRAASSFGLELAIQSFQVSANPVLVRIDRRPAYRPARQRPARWFPASPGGRRRRPAMSDRLCMVQSLALMPPSTRRVTVWWLSSSQSARIAS